jgi:AraC family transcriptional regulator
MLPGPSRIGRSWPGLKVEYAWLPPFAGLAVTRPNRLEVVFSAHSRVAIELRQRVYDIDVEPGAMYVVGKEPTTLLNVSEYSDTLEMYPDRQLLQIAAERENIQGFELEPTLRGQQAVAFRRDAVVLGAAHVLRRACLQRLDLSDIEANSLAHLLIDRLLAIQEGLDRSELRRLRARAISRLGTYIEDHLAQRITLEDLAAVVDLSPFHFARCFKASIGLAPHQYVLARRVELAKHLIMTTTHPVEDIAWSVGFENVSHFRRQFVAQIGILPGDLRRTTR